MNGEKQGVEVFTMGDKQSPVDIAKAAIAHGAHAGQIVQRVAAYTGGKGGGKAEQAMAGVGQTYMIDEALMAAENIIRNLISEG